MVMPDHLFLVRHGESEGNVAALAAKRGEEPLPTDPFYDLPGRAWALTDKGRVQAATIGTWLRGALEEIGRTAGATPTGRRYVSPYVRTRQTAAGLRLGSALQPVGWYVNRSLRERDWGDIESIPKSEFDFAEQYEHSRHKRAIDPLYWHPPGGESLCDVAENRVRNFLDTLHRECSGQTVVAVTHGEFMMATRLVLERADDETFADWLDDPRQRLENCAVLHYTRIPPGAEPHRGAPAPRLAYLRRARPVQADGAWRVEVTPWRRIDFALPTDDELLARWRV